MTLRRPEDYIEKLGKISYDYFLEKSVILGTDLEFKSSQKQSKNYKFDRERKNYTDWFGEAVHYCRPTIMILIIKILLEDKKRKDVLEDLKLIVNKSFILLDLCEFLNKIFRFEIADNNISTDVIVCYTPEIFSELFEHLLYLEAIYDRESFHLFLDEKCFIKFKQGIFKAIDRYEAGLIIVKNIERALDDEFHLTELRKKIDLRKFLDLMEEKEN